MSMRPYLCDDKDTIEIWSLLKLLKYTKIYHCNLENTKVYMANIAVFLNSHLLVYWMSDGETLSTCWILAPLRSPRGTTFSYNSLASFCKYNMYIQTIIRDTDVQKGQPPHLYSYNCMYIYNIIWDTEVHKGQLPRLYSYDYMYIQIIIQDTEPPHIIRW